MTQSKPKPKPAPKRLSPFDRLQKLLDQCSDEELQELTKEINQLLWERQMVAEAEATAGQSIDGFVFLEELRQKAESRLK